MLNNWNISRYVESSCNAPAVYTGLCCSKYRRFSLELTCPAWFDGRTFFVLTLCLTRLFMVTSCYLHFWYVLTDLWLLWNKDVKSYTKKTKLFFSVVTQHELRYSFYNICTQFCDQLDLNSILLNAVFILPLQVFVEHAKLLD